MDEINEVLTVVVDKIDLLQKRLDEIDKMYEDGRAQNDERFHKLENTLYDEILTPAKAALDQYDDNEKFGAFTDKYGAQLSPYNDKLRPIEGKDFDIMRQAYDGFKDAGEGADEDAYVASLIQQVEEQLEEIKKAMGIAAEPAATEPEVKEVAVEAAPLTKDEKKDEKDADDAEEASEDDIKAYEDELRKFIK